MGVAHACGTVSAGRVNGYYPRRWCRKASVHESHRSQVNGRLVVSSIWEKVVIGCCDSIGAVGTQTTTSVTAVADRSISCDRSAGECVVAVVACERAT